MHAKAYSEAHQQNNVLKTPQQALTVRQGVPASAACADLTGRPGFHKPQFINALATVHTEAFMPMAFSKCLQSYLIKPLLVPRKRA